MNEKIKAVLDAMYVDDLRSVLSVIIDILYQDGSDTSWDPNTLDEICYALADHGLMPPAEAMLRIKYRCPFCHEEWEDTHTSACDSTCPVCDTKDISALSWEPLNEA